MNHRLSRILNPGSREFEKENPSAFRSAKHTITQYGITPNEYNELWHKQDGFCAICKQECVKGKGLAIDHCHTTGEVRGLLCMRCNTALGSFKDDVSRLQAAIDYLNTTSEHVTDDISSYPIASYT